MMSMVNSKSKSVRGVSEKSGRSDKNLDKVFIYGLDTDFYI